MSNKKTNKYRKKQDRNSLGGSGTRDYNRNKRLILAGETYRSQKRTGPGKAPSRYKGRYKYVFAEGWLICSPIMRAWYYRSAQ